jgi:hypothetical protein
MMKRISSWRLDTGMNNWIHRIMIYSNVGSHWKGLIMANLWYVLNTKKNICKPMVYENTCTRTWSYMVISCNAHSSKRKLCGSRMYLGPSIPSLQGTNSLGDHDTTEPLKKTIHTDCWICWDLYYPSLGNDDNPVGETQKKQRKKKTT